MRKQSIFNAPCAGVIVFDQSFSNVVLVSTHRQNWGFPKGKREKTDLSALHAALRELKEESSLIENDIRILSNETIVENSRKGNPATEYFVAVCISDSVVLCPEDTDEIAVVKWVSISEIDQYLDERRQHSLMLALRKTN